MKVSRIFAGVSFPSLCQSGGSLGQSGQVFKTTFYMGVFNGSTPKRHYMWSNSASLCAGIQKKAGYMSRNDQALCAGKTCTVYYDANGVKRRKGTECLKESQ